MALTGLQYEITAGEHSATVVEVGAGLRRYTFQGVDVTASYSEDVLPPKGVGAVLVPWPNRLRGGKYSFGGRDFQLALTEPTQSNAIHGLGRWVRWTPLAIDASSVTLAIDIVPQTGWIFELRVEVTYSVHPVYGLTVSALARNTGAWAAPFGAGFHPYLSVHGHRLDDVTVQLPASKRIVTDSAQVPVGLQSVGKTHADLRRGRRLRSDRFDDGFTGLTQVEGRTRVEVRTRSGGAQLWADPTFGYLQLFTLDELMPGLSAVAVEPMTCPADAFNSGDGLIVLEPGAEWTGSWGIVPLV